MIWLRLQAAKSARAALVLYVCAMTGFSRDRVNKLLHRIGDEIDNDHRKGES